MSSAWQNAISAAQQLRRELHQYPELGWQEQRTAERIRRQLTELDIPWQPCADTGTVARLGQDQGSSGRHIALRGDIDALPIHEQNDHPWRSRHEGCMHACGHDGHTATLMAAAHWLKLHEAQLSAPVSLLFQPAEEGGHGAREMIADGALEGVDAIYGWHNWPALPFGMMLCPDHAVMSGNGTFEIIVTGRGGHASQPEQCADPVLAASAIILNLQQVVSRRLPPQKAAVVSVTSIDARSGETVIPQSARLAGSIRIPDDDTRSRVNALITEVCQHSAASYGVSCEVQHKHRYNATINHAHHAGIAREHWAQLWGSAALDRTSDTPIMASEDFSYYLQKIPGAFALIGSDDGPDHRAPCHNASYDFNDRLIPRVTAYFSRLAGIAVPADIA
ncbi:amidohydrolase [Seongchinamella sediminis]|uniref:Amidohydrolase n=1 Tax=Seongchinamella sediminis TaxID=2283635 RepID=A0A3L7E0I2_9GAMM|nr:N(2)-acetyl-L-2,4-diaminobutanoate deacetylase DoeB2 [Seongchinamella sediminis]RLQ21751.1 amidohydrolase [Seongchinamella sediminis]